MNRNQRIDDCTQDFLVEVLKGSAALRIDLEKLGATPDDMDLIRSIFRTLHNIKGTSGFLGLPNLGRLSHAAENVVGRLRDRTLRQTPCIIATLLQCVGAIKDIVATIELLDEGAQCNEALLAALDALSHDVLPSTLHYVSSDDRLSIRTPLHGTGEPLDTRPEICGTMSSQPIATVWAILPEIIRELACQQGKKIDLVMEGADTTLDCRALELIKAPLVHLIRNAVDHGIEMPAVRAALGKADTGRIRLCASRADGYTLIEIADDGRGLDHAKIRLKVVENGLADATELAALPDATVSRYVLEPGISTATEITEISGRGVGLDVVRTNIESIDGTVEIISKPNRGTSFTIRIPCTGESSLEIKERKVL